MYNVIFKLFCICTLIMILYIINIDKIEGLLETISDLDLVQIEMFTSLLNFRSIENLKNFDSLETTKFYNKFSALL